MKIKILSGLDLKEFYEKQSVLAPTYNYQNIVTTLYDDMVRVREADPSTLLVHKGITVSDETILCVEILYARGALSEKQRHKILNCPCGEPMPVVCACCLQVGVLKQKGCDNRLCLKCHWRKKAKSFHDLKYFFDQLPEVRFLTIGFKNAVVFSEAYWDECHDTFRLWRQGMKRKNFDLGNYLLVVEVKYHARGEPRIDSKTKEQLGTYATDEWNLHYHVLFDGGWLDQKVASKMLEKASKGKSKYVWIEYVPRDSPVYNVGGALHYTLKYLGKAEHSMRNPLVLAHFYYETKGKRFLNRGILKKDRDKKQPKPTLTCSNCQGDKWYWPWAMSEEEYEALVKDRPVDEDLVIFGERKSGIEDYSADRSDS